MIKWFTMVLLVVGLSPAVGVAGGNHGHHAGMKKHRGMKGKALYRALKRADLSDEQQEQMKALFKKYKSARKKLHQSKMKKVDPMMMLLSADDPSRVLFKEVRQQREQLRLQQERMHFRHLKAIVSLLDPEQRQKVLIEIEGMKTKWQQRQKRRKMRRWKRRGNDPQDDFVDERSGFDD